MAATFWQQLKTLLWRNYVLKKRNKKQLAQEILFPIYFVLLMAVIKMMIKAQTFPAVPKFSENSLSYGKFHFSTSKKLLASPNSTQVESLMAVISSLLDNVAYESFSSRSEAEVRYKQNPTDVAAGIVFNFTGTTKSYAIRMPYGSLPPISELFTRGRNQGDCRRDVHGRETGPSCRANMYLTSGFVWLQNAIDTALIKTYDSSFPLPSVSVQLMPKDKYTTDISAIQMISSIYFVMAYSFLINYLCVCLVAEKEKKIREGMKMMGLRDSVWWLSWMLVYMLIIVVVTIIIIVVVIATSFFAHSNVFVVFVMLYLYGLSIINVAFLLTPFFRKAKVAGGVASFSTIVIGLLYLAVSFTRTPSSSGGYNYGVPPAGRWAFCLLSPVALALALDQGIYLDIAKGGISFSTITLGDFPLFAPILMLFLDCLLYFFLAVYFDHVIPGEFGPRYKPWFCLMPSYWFGKQNTTELPPFSSLQGEALIDPDSVEAVPAELASKAGLRILNISKEFQLRKNTIRAVNGLTLDIYEGQITALLGHNGAGKTTLINMLCGLSPPTSGTATIMGLDVSHSGDMSKVRAITGVCPQHNILYDELTCNEHLVIFAGIKGVRDADRTSLIQKAMIDADIAEQADVPAKNLSGGQKRKLSVAIALIGDPKILFLDEPTAGMDPYSRRHLWSLLKKSKEGKIILLTTHFMDEADILADRKAVISHGRLKCCGSSLFLKNRFGIGYHLNMVVDSACRVERVFELLARHVTGVRMQRSHAHELSFTLPPTQVSRFPDMFRELESTASYGQTLSESLGIRSYGVSMTSLEEVFLKIGENDDSDEDSSKLESQSNCSREHMQHSAPFQIPGSPDFPVNVTVLPDLHHPSTNQPGTNHQPINEPGTNQPGTNQQPINEPNTNQPGTNQQPINEPGTNQPGTNQPGTNQPGTNQQPINEPSTNQPGTNQQPINEPSTNQPGTNQPGTNQPGTNQPGTNQQPIGEPSTNQPGTNQQHINEPSTNQPGTNQQPINEPSTNQPGTNQQPINEPSTNQPGTNQQPINEPSTNQPGTNQQPISEPSTNQPGTNQQPINEPSTNQPGTNQQPINEPSTNQPGTNQQPISEPSTNQPGTNQQPINEPSTNQPGTNQQPINEPSTNQPGTNQQPINEPSTNQPGTNQQPINEPNTNQPGTNQQPINEPSTNQPGTNQQPINEPSTNQPGTNQPGTNQPGTNQPGTNQPGTNQPGTNQLPTGHPSARSRLFKVPSSLTNAPIKTDRLTSQRFWALLKIRFLLRIRSKAHLFFQTVLPVGLVITGCVLSKLSSSHDSANPSPLTIKPFYVQAGEAPLLVVNSTGTPTLNSFVDGLKREFKNAVDQVNASVPLYDLPKHWMGVEMTELQSNLTSRYLALYNDSAIHSLPAVINLVSNQILSLAANTTGISVSSLVWPSTKTKLSYSGSAFSAALVLAMAFGMVTPGFATEIVQDRQIQARSLLRVSGVTFNVYWTTLFLSHLGVFLVPTTLCLLIVIAAQIPSFSTGGAMSSLLLLFLANIPANLLLVYVFSFGFSKYETCQAVLPGVFIFVGMIPYFAISVLDMLGMAAIAMVLHYLFTAIDPPYVVYGGIYYIDKVSRVASSLQQSITFESYFKWSNNILITIVMPVIQVAVLYLLLRVLDVRSTGGEVRDALKWGRVPTRDIPEENFDIVDDEDEDVSKERRRVANLISSVDSMPVLYVKNVRKEFKKCGKRPLGYCKKTQGDKVKVVVRNATFAVDAGEVFGLLGPNGAGKTTTLNIIIAETAATRGKVVVAGHNVHSNISEAFQVMSYCPQHDALWDSITLEEHLECYAAIRGVPQEEIDSVVRYYVDNLKLLEHQKKGAKKLSGGTRRKVSFVISMLGVPQIVLLDEPSTGMDPQSKRFFWDIISSSFDSTGRGAVLTTHSMEEADALCSRVAIMVNGQLQCLGPTQHLKDRFGSGYLLEVKLKITGADLDLEEQMDKLEGHLATIFPQLDCVERFAERGQYKIPKTDVSLLSRSFSALERMKTSHNVEEYSFNQSTLEQVFLDFAKKQYSEEMTDLDKETFNEISVHSSLSHTDHQVVHL